MADWSWQKPTGNKAEILRSLFSVANAYAVEHLDAFVRLTWPILNPGRPLVFGRHMTAICEHLEAVTSGKIRHIAIAVPPGHTKTSIASIAWPCWEWLKHPEKRFICAGYGDELSRKASKGRGDILRSTWYRALAAWVAQNKGVRPWQVQHDTQRELENDCGGFMLATSVGGQGTGRHGDTVILDDVLKQIDVYSVRMAQTNLWFRETMRSRVTDVNKAAFVIVGQRLAELDLLGTVIQDPAWDHLRLPAEFSPEPEKQSRSSIGWKDWRTEPGEPLFPQRFSREYLDHEKGPFGIGPIAFSAQHNQDPISGEGGMFQRHWWRFWTDDLNAPPAERLPLQPDELCGSWDMSFKGGKDSDFVVGQVWARSGTNFYLLDQIRARLGFGDTREAFRQMKDAWPACGRWLVEEKANGAAIIDELRVEIPGIIAVVPTESKAARAAAASGYVQGGNVWLPSMTLLTEDGRQRYQWVQIFLDESSAFPISTYDDQIDAFTMAVRDMGARMRRSNAWHLPAPIGRPAPNRPAIGQLDIIESIADLDDNVLNVANLFARSRDRFSLRPGELPPEGLPPGGRRRPT